MTFMFKTANRITVTTWTPDSMVEPVVTYYNVDDIQRARDAYNEAKCSGMRAMFQTPESLYKAG